MLFEKILISIDFSEESKLLLCCINEFKNFGLKEVILTHIIDIRSAGGNASSFVPPNEKKLAEIKKELAKDAIKSKVVVRIGFPAVEINNIAKEENVSMILAGSHGRGFIKSFFLGSTAFDLLRITDTALLIERFKQDKEELKPYCKLKFPKVLVATDFSECSNRLMDVIEKNIKSFREIYIIHVIEKAHNKEDFEKLKEEAESRLKKIKDGIDSRIKVKTLIKAGTASKSIIEVAQKEEVSLIMLTKRGHSGVKELLLGSTAQDIAMHSTKNALLVIPC
ncbi:MAG: universal stress protein [Actinobacteria bacterium]|nr:universal stress protein [Actinomycetota bacterium]